MVSTTFARFVDGRWVIVTPATETAAGSYSPTVQQPTWWVEVWYPHHYREMCSAESQTTTTGGAAR